MVFTAAPTEWGLLLSESQNYPGDSAESFLKKPPTRERNQALGSSRSAVLQGGEKDGTGFDESTNVPHCNAAYLRRKTEANRY